MVCFCTNLASQHPMMCQQRVDVLNSAPVLRTGLAGLHHRSTDATKQGAAYFDGSDHRRVRVQ